MLNLGLCKFVHLNRHVPIVFLVKQQITAFGSDYVHRTDGRLNKIVLIGCSTKNTIGT